jgi:hypothetical protein
MTIAGLLAAAAAILFWPKGKPLPSPLFVPTPAKAAGPSFLEATASLADVRKRLVATDLLSDAEKKAIDVLQLALTAGSDQS